MFGNLSFFWAVCLLAVLSVACKPQPKTATVHEQARVAQAKIDSLEKALVQSLDAAKAGGTTPDPDSEQENVLNLIQTYQHFRVDYRMDTAAPIYTLKEAQLFYNYLRDYEQAEKMFTYLLDSFPQAPNRPSALFFLANCQHDKGDTARAQASLRRLVEEYPQSGAAKMAPQFSAMMRNGLPSEADSVTP